MEPLPPGDVLVHAGDFSNDGSPDGVKEIIDFNAWLGEQDFEHKIIIAGNHDIFFQVNPRAARALIDNGTYLQDGGTTVGRIKFYGSPFTPRFFDWAFMLDRRSEELRAKWDLIPDDTEVLITHGPPNGVRDMLPTRKGEEYLGCEELSKRTPDLVNLRLHVFGHIHAGYGRCFNSVNAAVCNEAMRPINPPIVVDI